MQVKARVVIGLTIGLFWGLAALVPVVGQENLVLNGGFEVQCTQTDDIWQKNRHSEDEPAHWLPLRYLNMRHLPVMHWDDQVAHSGSRSIRVTVQELDPEAPNVDRCWQTRIPASDLVGKTVTLSFYMRTEDIPTSGYAHASLQCRESSADWRARDPQMTASPHMYLGVDTRHIVGTTDWTQYCVSLTVPEGTSNLFVYLGLRGLGTCWFDDVRLAVSDPCDQEPADTYVWMGNVEVDPNAPQTLPVRRREEPTPLTEPASPKPWTVLFYNDADFMGANPLEFFAAEAQSTDVVNVLVLEDPSDGDARLWHVACEGDESILNLLAEWGEPNMADGQTLSDFLGFADAYYPSDHVLVMVYDHGHGWWGACRDETNEIPVSDWRLRDWMTPSEMSEALAAHGGIDALLFTAPCLMAAVETAYEVRDETRLYVGSQENSGYVIWLGVIGAIVEQLSAHPEIDTESLGRFLIERILIANEEEDDAPAHWNRTISATSTAGLKELADAIDEFASALIAELDESFERIRAARESTQSFGINEMIDIVDFVQRCAAAMPRLADSSLRVQRAVYATVVGSLWDSRHPSAHGLTLYFPYPDPRTPEESQTLSYAETRDTYVRYGLSLLADTQWDEFLDRFFDRMDETTDNE